MKNVQKRLTSRLISIMLMVISHKMQKGVGQMDEHTYGNCQKSDINTAFNLGYQAGVYTENMRQQIEWDQFFHDAQLYNTISGKPITSLEEFWSWKSEYVISTAKQRRESGISQSDQKVHVQIESLEDCISGCIALSAVRISDLFDGIIGDESQPVAMFIVTGALCAWAKNIFYKNHYLTQSVIDSALEQMASEKEYSSSIQQKIEALTWAAYESMLCALGYFILWKPKFWYTVY